ncbi:peptidoglycan DD-metalloendopeptidase family protein [Altererythrobacter salegens]|uniref:Peptidoglycan DD-metalloendopeptidase family protein n=1 Tax=Croceibacterium salegens TaxID=1737568 RepID=A0A6I4SWX6_9SPHN|nr:peptidoglycan DD-metalloendopeptidase family protein [Croceibacterium salegens]MXO60545.1 peptidoglycan DD-metalloendopeptidase family protein [Croceibacterium salegens]
MKRALPLLAIALAAALGVGAYGAAPLFDDPGETREAMRQALSDQKLAETRSKQLEAEAARATVAADKTRREAAALAARVQQAEAGIAAAEARIKLVDRERATLREELGRQQGPLVKLTAALQQFSRRPAALSILRPGSVRDIVYTRALLSNAVPTVQRRTSGLRARLARSRALRAQAVQAAAVLRDEQENFDTRSAELAALETRQRLASREAGGNAAREAERALALAEQARDLDSLVGQLDKDGDLRRRLAALPGPVLRPPDPELARNEAVPEPVAPAGDDSAGPPPSPYYLPVTGRTVSGFGTPSEGGQSSALTLAPRGGAQVVSPAAGRVVFAGPYRGYGRIVIIEHAGGWTSLVTGMARIDVQVGATLVGGAPLGIAGQGRPTIALELRRGGEPVNPLQFVG